MCDATCSRMELVPVGSDIMEVIDSLPVASRPRLESGSTMCRSTPT